MAEQGSEHILECLPPNCMKERNVGSDPFVHIVQTSECSRVSCLCLLCGPRMPLTPECHQPTDSLVLSGCLRSAPRKLCAGIDRFAARGSMFLFSVGPSCVSSRPPSCSHCLPALFHVVRVPRVGLGPPYWFSLEIVSSPSYWTGLSHLPLPPPYSFCMVEVPLPGHQALSLARSRGHPLGEYFTSVPSLSPTISVMGMGDPTSPGIAPHQYQSDF